MQVLDVSCGDLSLTFLTHHQSSCSDLSSVNVRIMFVILQLSSFMTFTVYTKVWRQFQAETKDYRVGSVVETFHCLYIIDIIHKYVYIYILSTMLSGHTVV